MWVKRGEWTKAITDCGEAIRLDPKQVAFYQLRGAAHDKLGQYDAALADFDKVLELAPHAVESHIQRAQMLWKKREYEKVVEACETAIRLKVQSPALFVFCGNARLWCDKRDYERALKDYDEALKLDPLHVVTLLNRSLLFASCPDVRYRDANKAKADALRACELTRWADAEALTSLAAAYAEAGEFSDAVKLQKRALEDPAFALARGSEGSAALTPSTSKRSRTGCRRSEKSRPVMPRVSPHSSARRAGTT